MRSRVRDHSESLAAAAAVGLLVSALVSVAGSTAASLPVLAVAFVFAMVAVSKRRQYAR